jgi:hypothetical protein
MLRTVTRIGRPLYFGKTPQRGIASFRSGNLSGRAAVVAILVEYGGQWWCRRCGIVVGVLMNGPEEGKE